MLMGTRRDRPPSGSRTAGGHVLHSCYGALDNNGSQCRYEVVGAESWEAHVAALHSDAGRDPVQPHLASGELRMLKQREKVGGLLDRQIRAGDDDEKWVRICPLYRKTYKPFRCAHCPFGSNRGDKMTAHIKDNPTHKREV
jgi:hypothetical protein